MRKSQKLILSLVRSPLAVTLSRADALVEAGRINL
jgi:hypothetical protein